MLTTDRAESRNYAPAAIEAGFDYSSLIWNTPDDRPIVHEMLGGAIGSGKHERACPERRVAFIGLTRMSLPR
jgi:hypothetical protein